MNYLGMPLGMWAVFSKLLHFRLIPHFVQIRIQKFRCKAVGADIFSGFLRSKPLATVHFVVDIRKRHSFFP